MIDKKIFELTYGNKLYSTELNSWWVITFMSYCIDNIKNGNINIDDISDGDILEMPLFFDVKSIDNFMTSKIVGINDIGYGKKYLTEAQKRCSIINELL